MDLGTIGGDSRPVAINERGQVVGSSSRGGQDRAIIWQDGKLRDLGTLPGDTSSEAVAVNDRGQVAVNSYRSGLSGGGVRGDGQYHAAVWRGGTLSALPALGGRESWTTAINARGEIAGVAATGATRTAWGLDDLAVVHAARWRDLRIRDLGVDLLKIYPGSGEPSDWEVDDTTAINERGAIVGYTWNRGFLWRGGRLTWFGPWSSANAINERGQVVGSRSRGAHRGAFIWQDGTLRDLGTLPGDTSSEAVAINEGGQVVGTSCFQANRQAAPRCRAFLWDRGKPKELGRVGTSSMVAINDVGQVVFTSGAEHAVLWQAGHPIDLGTLPGDSSSAAVAINNRGQVIGVSSHEGSSPRERAVLWTPRRQSS